MQYQQHLPAIVASLITSAVMFLAGHVYEGYRVRAVALLQIEQLNAKVATLEARLAALEHAKK
jgi:cell division protein FtsB